MAAMLPALVSMLVSLGLFLPSSLSTSSLTFSLTYIDAQSSPLRSLHANAADLAQSMPMRDFVGAGRAMRARLGKHRNKAGPFVGKISYMHDKQGDFYLTVPVGTPPQDLLFLVDTGSDLSWSPCCRGCTHTILHHFVPNQSSSFRNIPCSSSLCMTRSLVFMPCNNFCNFSVLYGDGSFAAGLLSIDSFHLSPHYSKLMVFGCAVDYIETVPTPAGTSGLMGLSPAPFSFASQLFGTNPHLQKKFAHCLPDRFANLNAPGTIQFGNYELAAVNLSYTPLVISYSPMAELFYYVKLEGIRVGGSLIKVANKGEGVAGRGGTIFDSGTAMTNLESSVYKQFLGEMKRQTLHLWPFALTAGLDLCYKVPLKARELPKLPLVTLHFAGMVDLELKPESILYSPHSNSKSIFLCLAFEKSDDALNIIGNYQQQNYWVEYNLQTSHLGLAKARCAK